MSVLRIRPTAAGGEGGFVSVEGGVGATHRHGMASIRSGSPPVYCKKHVGSRPASAASLDGVIHRVLGRARRRDCKFQTRGPSGGVAPANDHGTTAPEHHVARVEG